MCKVCAYITPHIQLSPEGFINSVIFICYPEPLCETSLSDKQSLFIEALTVSPRVTELKNMTTPADTTNMLKESFDDSLQKRVRLLCKMLNDKCLFLLSVIEKVLRAFYSSL